MSAFVNKVAASGILTIDLAQFLPEYEEFTELDIKQFLYMEMILKEKDFREQVKTYDWSVFQDKYVSILNDDEAIVPAWAFMIIATHLKGVAKDVFLGNKEEHFKNRVLSSIAEFEIDSYADQRVVIKGCGDKSIPDFAFLKIAQRLLPHVKSVMYGEPCSTVPVYKRKTVLPK